MGIIKEMSKICEAFHDCKTCLAKSCKYVMDTIDKGVCVWRNSGDEDILRHVKNCPRKLAQVVSGTVGEDEGSSSSFVGAWVFGSVGWLLLFGRIIIITIIVVVKKPGQNSDIVETATQTDEAGRRNEAGSQTETSTSTVFKSGVQTRSMLSGRRTMTDLGTGISEKRARMDGPFMF